MKKFVSIMLVLLLVLSLTSCGKKKDNFDPSEKSDGVMTYAQYAAAAVDTEVTVECFVMDHQSWWDNKITVYCADPDGAYFLYELPCSEADSKKLVPGTMIRVKGVKSEWSGEVEIVDSSFEILDKGTWTPTAFDATSLFGKDDELAKHMNQLVTFKNVTVEANSDGAAFTYKWDGSGEQGDDVYFYVSLNGTSYQFLIESYLRDSGTTVYKAAEALKAGDKVTVEGYLYWYNGPQMHVINITK
ncbi:MAG: hypothetical protein J6Z24_02905 [Oscillospiraceae bacterium]|nr:hypothetical protein [Oscillospiraceae bacterium]MBR4827770.1 hypothetical protein [Oscillospiraceae bacterium]MBR5065405.1 hypothetical protein [Oscillospiraceae bacterium]